MTNLSITFHGSKTYPEISLQMNLWQKRRTAMQSHQHYGFYPPWSQPVWKSSEFNLSICPNCFCWIITCNSTSNDGWMKNALTRIVLGFIAPIPDILMSCLNPSLNELAIVISTKALIFRWSTKEIQWTCSDYENFELKIRLCFSKFSYIKNVSDNLNRINGYFFKICLDNMTQNI